MIGISFVKLNQPPLKAGGVFLEMSVKNRVLILGGRGLLGYHFMQGLEEKYQILGTTRSEKTKSNEIYFNSEQSSSTLRKILDEFQPNVIVNTIGFVTVEGCQLDREKGLIGLMLALCLI